jgi:hypothetical protein
MSDHAIQPEDLLLSVDLSIQALTPALSSDWEIPAGDLDWTCRRTLDHVVDALILYSGRLALQATERLPPLRNGDPERSPGELLVNLGQAAAVLATVVREAPDDARGFHSSGMADRSGFAALGCEEILCHTHDIATGLGLTFQPPDDLCLRVVQRLFPWAPENEGPWDTLLWATGHDTLPEHGRLGPDWSFQAAPLDEWDGTRKTRTTPPTWT